MIKVQQLENTDSKSNDYYVKAFADTREEVDNGGEFIGLPEGAGIEMGSSVMTASGELAFMQSDGHWNWGDE